MMTVAGKLEDGRPVVSGWFYLVDRHGLSPDDVVSELSKKGMVPDAISFIEEAVNSGWKMRTAMARLGLS